MTLKLFSDQRRKARAPAQCANGGKICMPGASRSVWLICKVSRFCSSNSRPCRFRAIVPTRAQPVPPFPKTYWAERSIVALLTPWNSFNAERSPLTLHSAQLTSELPLFSFNTMMARHFAPWKWRYEGEFGSILSFFRTLFREKFAPWNPD